MSRWLWTGPDDVTRCWWCAADEQYITYHDEEWGRPVDDDRRLLEELCLEGFQCGLSWLTIRRKRQRFREVFHGFQPQRVAAMTARDVRRLLRDPGIVRHRGKIESTINNARRAVELIDEAGSLARFLRPFAPAPTAPPRTGEDLPTRTAESEALSRELKRRGFTYVGPTTMYAFMQAVGVVNDHLALCDVRVRLG